jgi:hypothetical protein
LGFEIAGVFLFPFTEGTLCGAVLSPSTLH